MYQELKTARGQVAAIVVPGRWHQVIKARVAHRHVCRADCGIHPVHLLWLVSAVLVGALASSGSILLRIPPSVTAVHQCGDFIAVPGSMLCREGFSVTRTEVNSLNVTVAVGVDTRVKTIRWVVVWMGVSIRIHTQNFPA